MKSNDVHSINADDGPRSAAGRRRAESDPAVAPACAGRPRRRGKLRVADAPMLERHLLALQHLRNADPRMSALIERIGPFAPTITRDPFTALVGSIIHQQISMRAATSIQSKLRALCAGGRIRPQTLLALDARKLRGAGLSHQKTRYLRAVARSFADGALSARRLRRMSDDEVIEVATELPGVGRWTAEMLLMFSLERPDVWPADDLGLRSALRRFLSLAELPTPRQARPLGEHWAPFRTYACWYLWRSLENPVLPGIAGAL